LIFPANGSTFAPRVLASADASTGGEMDWKYPFPSHAGRFNRAKVPAGTVAIFLANGANRYGPDPLA
jgi:hypothetical protein